MNYRYQIIFHTPVGMFSTQVKEDSEEIIRKKMEYYSDTENITDGVSIDSGPSQVYIPAPILKQSVIEFNYNV